MNPLGKVPTIRDENGEIFYESLPVSDFLDEKYPGERILNPAKPEDKAKDKMMLARFEASVGSYYKIIFSKTPEERQELLSKFRDSVKFLEKELESRGTKFFQEGSQPGMFDYMIWPWFERLEVFPMIHKDLEDLLPQTSFPALVKISSFLYCSRIDLRIQKILHKVS